MKKIVCRILPVLAIALVIAMVAGVASAQIVGTPEEFSTNYYSNNTTSGAPAATLRLSQHGSVAENECALIYVFDSAQEPLECCGCLVTANGLQTINVRTQLTANPVLPFFPNTGVVQIVSGLPTGGGVTGPKGNNSPSCNPANVNLSPEIDSWMTHVQNKGTNGATGFAITESKGDEEFLSAAELLNTVSGLEADCSFIQAHGSKFGVCDCGTFENAGDGITGPPSGP
jgi:hypothetical protein